jgi:hypothetical protein
MSRLDFTTDALLRGLSRYPVAKGDLVGHPFHGNQYRRDVIGSTHEVNGYKIHAESDLANANLSEAELQYTNLQDADLSKADVSYADMTGCLAHDLIAEGANFDGADLTGAVLMGANLRNTVFTGVTLAGTDLRDADFSGADLRGSNLSTARLAAQDGTKGARGDGYTQLPKGYGVDDNGFIVRYGQAAKDYDKKFPPLKEVEEPGMTRAASYDSLLAQLREANDFL